LTFITPKFYYLAQNKYRNLGKDQRRHPYKLNEHSNSFKNFEIHIFANINIPEKSRMLHMWTRDVMRDSYSLKERVEFLILASRITLYRHKFSIELSFNKVLKVMKDLEDIRLFLDQIDPHVLAIVIYEANVICVPPKQGWCQPPNIRKD
jgi:hypothetical protein